MISTIIYIAVVKADGNIALTTSIGPDLHS